MIDKSKNYDFKFDLGLEWMLLIYLIYDSWTKYLNFSCVEVSSEKEYASLF